MNKQAFHCIRTKGVHEEFLPSGVMKGVLLSSVRNLAIVLLFILSFSNELHFFAHATRGREGVIGHEKDDSDATASFLRSNARSRERMTSSGRADSTLFIDQKMSVGAPKPIPYIIEGVMGADACFGLPKDMCVPEEKPQTMNYMKDEAQISCFNLFCHPLCTENSLTCDFEFNGPLRNSTGSAHATALCRMVVG